MYLSCPACRLRVRRSSDDALGGRCPRCGATGVWGPALRPADAAVASSSAAPPGDFRVETARRGRALTVLVSGEIDIATVAPLRAAIRLPEDEDIEALVVDLSEATFIDSAGVQVLIEARHGARRGGVRLAVITTPNSVVDRTLELLELHSWLPVCAAFVLEPGT